MLQHPTFSTEATDELCKDIAKRSNGVCLFGFSRGKDSLCAFLQLRRFFKRIIPFHCAAIPGLNYAEQALLYDEEMFNTRILRMTEGTVYTNLYGGMYQTLEGLCDLLVNRDFREYRKLDMLDELRQIYHIPKAWCAFGIAASDSLDRRIWVMNVQGRNEGNKTFYPCYDWPREKIIETVRESGLMLPPEYKYSKFSMPAMPCATYNRIFAKHFPDDYERMKDVFPLMEAKTFREELLDRDAAERKRSEIEFVGGVASADDRELLDGGGKYAEEDESGYDDEGETMGEFADTGGGAASED